MGLKFLLLILVIALAVGWVFTRSRRKSKGPAAPAARPPAPTEEVQPVTMAMLACAHCEVHLPQDDALFDLAGRPYCSAEHRATGPR
jgi:uncharacterized protein